MRNESGQTLVEVLVGVTIFAIVIVVLMQAVLAGIWGTHRVDQRTTALNLAQSQMQYIQSQPFNDDANGYILLSPEEIPTGFTVGYNGTVEMPGLLQQIDIVVSFGQNTIEFIGYKVNDEAALDMPDLPLICNILIDVPELPGFEVCPNYYQRNLGYEDKPTGYFYTFELPRTCRIAVVWKVHFACGPFNLVDVYLWEGTPFGNPPRKPWGEMVYWPDSNPANYGESLISLKTTIEEAQILTFATDEALQAGNYTVYFYNAQYPEGADPAYLITVITDFASISYYEYD